MLSFPILRIVEVARSCNILGIFIIINKKERNSHSFFFFFFGREKGIPTWCKLNSLTSVSSEMLTLSAEGFYFLEFICLCLKPQRKRGKFVTRKWFNYPQFY